MKPSHKNVVNLMEALRRSIAVPQRRQHPVVKAFAAVISWPTPSMLPMVFCGRTARRLLPCGHVA
jgi:hypothetical protein